MKKSDLVRNKKRPELKKATLFGKKKETLFGKKKRTQSILICVSAPE